MLKSIHTKFLLGIIFPLIIMLYSCSTVRVIPEGESMLKKNKVEITIDSKVKTGEWSALVRQQPNNSVIFAWKPLVVLYNWFGGKIGQAPVIFDSTMVDRSIENIDNYLTSLGYYNSVITDSVSTLNKKTSVHYFITPGKTFMIDTVCYHIRDSAIQKIVQEDLPKATIKKGSILSEKSLDIESERISTMLRDNGYYNFNKNFFFFEADTTGGDSSADLHVAIENFTRNENAADSRPHDIFRIRHISVYSDYDPMMERYEGVSPEFHIYERANLKIFEMNKKNSIRPEIIEHLNLLRPGEIYSEKDANNTYSRFVSLRYYSGVNLQFDEVAAADNDTLKEVDCVIKLTPSKSQGYKINLETSTNSNGLLGISPNISYYHKNLFRGGEWFTMGFMGNFQFKINDTTRSTEFGVSAGISFPDFLLLPEKLFKTHIPRTDISIGYNHQSRAEFVRNLISSTFGYNWRVGEKLTYTFNPLQLNIIKLSNIDQGFYDDLKNPFLRNAYRNYFDLGIGGAVYYNTSGINVAPGMSKEWSAFYMRWTVDLSGNLLSAFNKAMPADSTGARTIWNTPYAQYLRSDLTLTRTWRFAVNNVLATRLNIGIGYSYGNSAVMPFEKLFYVGGTNSMRAWSARSLGPGSSGVDRTFSIPNQTGDMKLEFNAEYRFKMFWKFESALFVDVGNIWNIRADEDNKDELFHINDFYKSLAANWGTGIRLNLNFVIFRIDMGMIVRDPHRQEWLAPGEWLKKNNYAVQFGVGYPF